MGGHIAVIDARFYEDIADELVAGALQVLRESGASHARFSVPGVLEIPPALAMTAKKGRFDAYVLLGCVIRGETSHYDIVANESARAIMALATRKRLAVGNGILTVENGAQAMVRAGYGHSGKDKGGDAARAALALRDLQTALSEGTGIS